MVARFRPLAVQYFWWISANLVKYPCGLPRGDRWILDSEHCPIATIVATVVFCSLCLQSRSMALCSWCQPSRS